TPQGAGIAVVTAAIVASAMAVWWLGPGLERFTLELVVLLVATIVLAIVGGLDDIVSLSIATRVALQIFAVAAVVVSFPTDLRLIPALPWVIERACLLFFFVWFVNLTNFMDGLDWLTLADALPLTAIIAIFGVIGLIPIHVTFIALALVGA